MGILLLLVEKGISGGICCTIHWYAKANNKYKKDCDKNIAFSYLCTCTCISCICT